MLVGDLRHRLLLHVRKRDGPVRVEERQFHRRLHRSVLDAGEYRRCEVGEYVCREDGQAARVPGTKMVSMRQTMKQTWPLPTHSSLFLVAILPGLNSFCPPLGGVL